MNNSQRSKQKKSPGRETEAFVTCITQLNDGARGSRINEPLVFDTTYRIQWTESWVDLSELAKLRWIKGLSYDELALHYGRTRNAISNYCQNIRRKDFVLPGLADVEREKIKWAYQS